jgi:hypothetical protein
MLIVDSSNLSTEHLFFNAGLIEKLTFHIKCKQLIIICSDAVKFNYESIYTKFSTKPLSVLCSSQQLLSNPILFTSYLLFETSVKKVVLINPNLGNLVCSLIASIFRRDLNIVFFLHGALTDKLIRPKGSYKAHFLSKLLLCAIYLAPKSFKLASLSTALKSRLPLLGDKLICFNSHAIPSDWPKKIITHYNMPAKSIPKFNKKDHLVVAFLGNFTEDRGASDFLKLAKSLSVDFAEFNPKLITFRVIGSTMMLKSDRSKFSKYLDFLDDGTMPHISPNLYYSNLIETDFIFFSPSSPQFVYRASSVQMEAISFGIPIITTNSTPLISLEDHNECSNGWSFSHVEDASSWLRHHSYDSNIIREKLLHISMLSDYYLGSDFYSSLSL